jgi:hypothetical protein
LFALQDPNFPLLINISEPPASPSPPALEKKGVRALLGNLHDLLTILIFSFSLPFFSSHLQVTLHSFTIKRTNKGNKIGPLQHLSYCY